MNHSERDRRFVAAELLWHMKYLSVFHYMAYKLHLIGNHLTNPRLAIG